MWFLKEATNKVWSAAKELLTDTRTPVQKLIDQITDSEDEIISTNKLNELATMTYDTKIFEEILDLSLAKIKVFRYDLEEARKNLNMLIAINYLIKHGATGFVDELRAYINMFKKYQALEPLKSYDDELTQQKFNYELQKIKSRAQHIETLLMDKNKLLKEKELSMLVKQKLKLYEKEKLTDIKRNVSNKNIGQEQTNKKQIEEHQTKMSKIESLMEKYLWTYVDKLDGKIDQISDKVMKNVDKYLLGEIPQNFQVEDQEVDHEQRTNHINFEEVDYEEIQDHDEANYKKTEKSLLDQDDDDLMKKLEEEGIEENKGNTNHPREQANLIDLEERIEKEVSLPKGKVQDLI